MGIPARSEGNTISFRAIGFPLVEGAEKTAFDQGIGRTAAWRGR